MRALAAFLVACAWLAAGAARAAFDLEDVAAKAQQLAREPFQDPKGRVPEWMLKMTYDQWRDIRFRPERALWADTRLPFRVQFFHAGLFYDHPVAMNVVAADGVQPVPFSTSQFDYGKNDFVSQIPHDLGYAGRVLTALPADAALRGMVTVAGGDEAGELLDQHVVKNPVTGGWRLSFLIRPKTDQPLELRAFLDQGGNALTETWTYGLPP